MPFGGIIQDLPHDTGHGLLHLVCSKLTFPDHDYLPAAVFQKPIILQIAFLVAKNLAFPEFSVRFRHDEFVAAVVPVPETAVDEDHGAVFPQND